MPQWSEKGLGVCVWISDICCVCCVYPQVQQGQVYYHHDSSETTEDSFTLMASAFDITRRSASLIVGITVIPVNDEPPRIQRNTGLEVHQATRQSIFPVLNFNEASRT